MWPDLSKIHENFPDRASMPAAGARVGVTPTFDEEGRLACELPCIGCGYALMRRRAEDACPECGRAIAQSLDAARPLLWPDREWQSLVGTSWVLLGAWVTQIMPPCSLLTGLLGLVAMFALMGEMSFDSKAGEVGLWVRNVGRIGVAVIGCAILGVVLAVAFQMEWMAGVALIGFVIGAMMGVAATMVRLRTIAMKMERKGLSAALKLMASLTVAAGGMLLWCIAVIWSMDDGSLVSVAFVSIVATYGAGCVVLLWWVGVVQRMSVAARRFRGTVGR